MPEKLSPVQVANLINSFGSTKQISKALRIFYQHDKNSVTSTALISAFVHQDLLSAWKLNKQYAPIASPELSCLAVAHYKKHPDYLRDNLRYAGFQGVDNSVTTVLHSAVLNKNFKEAVDLFGQVEKFEEPKECSVFAIKAFAGLGDVEKTTDMYRTIKCHASLASVMPESDLVDFLGDIDNKEKTRELFEVILERLQGDERFAVEQEMNERSMNTL